MDGEQHSKLSPIFPRTSSVNLDVCSKHVSARSYCFIWTLAMIRVGVKRSFFFITVCHIKTFRILIRPSTLIATFNHDYNVITSNAARFVHNRRTFDNGFNRNYFECVNFRGQKTSVNVIVRNMIRNCVLERLKCRLFAILSNRKPFVTSWKSLLFPTKLRWCSLYRPGHLCKTSEEKSRLWRV